MSAEQVISEQSANTVVSTKIASGEQGEEVLCTFTGLTAQQKTVLLNSWNQMQDGTKQSIQDCGKRLVIWMFDNIDDMLKLLFKNEKIKKNSIQLWFDGNTNFSQHNLVMAQGFDTLIRSLNNQQDFDNYVEKMITLHLEMEPSIGYTFFKQFEEKLHSFIMLELDVTADSPEVQAWRRLANTLSNRCTDLGGNGSLTKKTKSAFACCFRA